MASYSRASNEPPKQATTAISRGQQENGVLKALPLTVVLDAVDNLVDERYYYSRLHPWRDYHCELEPANVPGP